MGKRAGHLPDRKHTKDGLDYFPTPPDATRPFMEKFQKIITPEFQGTIWEPACGQGHMSEVLKEYGHNVISTDIADRGYGGVVDFLNQTEEQVREIGQWDIDAIITNPPYNRAEEFVEEALNYDVRIVALLARLQFIEGKARYEQIWGDPAQKPTWTLGYAERVQMVPNRLPNKDDAGSSIAFAWFVWDAWDESEHTKLDVIDNRKRHDPRQQSLV